MPRRKAVNEMKKLYEKNELTFALVWIVVYCVLQSLANPLNKAMGVAYAASAAFCVVQTVVLFTFIRKNNLQKLYGLCKFLFVSNAVLLNEANCFFAVSSSISTSMLFLSVTSRIEDESRVASLMSGVK